MCVGQRQSQQAVHVYFLDCSLDHRAPCADPVAPDACPGSHKSAKFENHRCDSAWEKSLIGRAGFHPGCPALGAGA